MNIPLDVLKEELAYHEARAARLRAIIAELEGIGPRSNGFDAVAMLELHCRERGIVIYPGGIVLARDAAKILGRKEKTLANQRSQLADDLPSTTYNGKPAYTLEALAKYLG